MDQAQVASTGRFDSKAVAALYSVAVNVVLIGANMPSVLAEISFISNPSDEQWLKKPESRQRVAEGLYRGIETYLQNTNSLSLNQIHAAAGNRAGIVARSGNSQ